MPVKIFCCYAHEDELLLNKLKTHLSPLQRQGLIDVWHDRDIKAGTEWEHEINEQLNAAQIILLLVSPDFINSDYCYGNEMKRAMERHERREACVIPIILRPVFWVEAPFSKLRALPKDGKPISTWANRDKVWADIVSQLREEIQHLTDNTLSITNQDKVKDARNSGVSFVRIAIDEQTKPLWSEADLFHKNYGDVEYKVEYARDPFLRNYVQHFYLNGDYRIDNVDPSFDVTILNNTTKPIILTHVGVEIVSVAHTRYYYGIPQSVKIEMAVSYTIHMPNIRNRVDLQLQDKLPPIPLHEVVSLPIPDPIYLQAKAPYRYKLLLHKYMDHMPNQTMLRMWIRTNQDQELSHEIYIFTL